MNDIGIDIHIWHIKNWINKYKILFDEFFDQ